MKNPDIDIDFADRSQVLKLIPHRAAGIERDGKTEPHPSGIYLQHVPFNPMNGVSNIDHRVAGELGYFKVDLLNNNAYQGVTSNEHLMQLITTEPNWDLLLVPDVVKDLYHVHNYGQLLRQYRPRSVMQLAMLLAIIRPAKRHLQGLSWEEIGRTVWDPPETGYHFKKSHSVAFSHVIVMQLNLYGEAQTK